MEEFVFDAREFSHAVAGGGSEALPALQKFCDVALSFRQIDVNGVDVASAYLEYRPGADELIRLVEIEKRSKAVIALEALTHLVLSKNGAALARKLLRQHSRKLHSVLTKGRGPISRNGLRLLTAIASISAPYKRDLISRFHLGSKELQHLFRPGASSRAAFFTLLIVLLENADQSTVSSIIVKSRSGVISILKAFNERHSSGVVKEGSKAKRAHFEEDEFFKVYCSSVPLLSDDQIRRAVGTPVLGLLCQVAGSGSEDCASLAAELFLHVSSKPKTANVTDLVRALLPGSFYSKARIDMLCKTLMNRPKLVSPFVREASLLLQEPKLSLSWITINSLLITALSVPLPGLWSEEDIIPERFFELAKLEKSLLHADGLIRQLSLQVMIAAVSRLNEAQNRGMKVEVEAMIVPQVIMDVIRQAVKDQGLISGLALRLLRLLLISNTGILSDSTSQITRILFADSCSIVRQGDKFPLAAMEHLRTCEVLLKHSGTHFFSGSDQKLSLLGELMDAYLVVSQPPLRLELSRVSKEILLASELFPGYSAEETEVWISVLSESKSYSIAILDQVICAAVQKPHVLVDDLLRAVRACRFEGEVSTKSLPFSPIAVGALRRTAKLLTKEDQSPERLEAIATLKQLLLSILRIQANCKPLAWLIADVLKDLDTGLVRFCHFLLEEEKPAAELGANVNLEEKLFVAEPSLIYGDRKICDDLFEQDKLELLPSGMVLSCVCRLEDANLDLCKIRELLNQESPDVVVRRIIFEISVQWTLTNFKAYSRGLSVLLLLLADFFETCTRRTKEAVLSCDVVRFIYASGQSAYVAVVLDMFAGGKYAEATYEKYMDYVLPVHELNETMTRSHLLQLSILGRTPLPSSVRSSLLSRILHSFVRIRQGSVTTFESDLLKAISELLSPTAALDSSKNAEHFSAIYEIIRRALCDPEENLISIAVRILTSNDTVMKGLVSIVIPIHAGEICTNTLRSVSSKRAENLSQCAREYPSLRSAFQQKLLVLDAPRAGGVDALIHLLPVYNEILAFDESSCTISELDRLYTAELVGQACTQSLTLGRKEFVELLLLKIASMSNCDQKQLSRVSRALCLGKSKVRKSLRRRLITGTDTKENSPRNGSTFRAWTTEKMERGSLGIGNPTILKMAVKFRAPNRLRKRCVDAVARCIKDRDTSDPRGIIQCLDKVRDGTKSLKRLLRKVDSSRLRVFVRKILRLAFSVDEKEEEFCSDLLLLVQSLYELYRRPVLDVPELRTSLRIRNRSLGRPFVKRFCELVLCCTRIDGPTRSARALAELCAESLFMGIGDEVDTHISALLSLCGLGRSAARHGPLMDSILLIEDIDPKRTLGGSSDTFESTPYSADYVLEAACRALARALVPGTDEIVDLKKMLDNGILGIALIALSAEEEQIRSWGYAYLHLLSEVLGAEEDTFRTNASASLFRERKQIVFFLNLIRRSITETMQLIPGITSRFLKLLVPIMMRPNHSLFLSVSRFLIRRPVLAMDDLYFISYFLSLDGESSSLRQGRMLALRAVTDGSISRIDHDLLRRRHIYEQLMIFATANVEGLNIDDNFITAVLGTLCHLASVTPGAAMELARKHGVFAWLCKLVEDANSTPRAIEYCRLLLAVVQGIHGRTERKLIAREIAAVATAILRYTLRLRRESDSNLISNLVEHVYKVLSMTTSVSYGRRGLIQMPLEEVLAAEEFSAALAPSQACRILSSVGIIVDPGEGDRLTNVALKCLQKLPRKAKADAFPSTSADEVALGAFTSELICIHAPRATIEGAPNELKWSLCSVLLCTDNLQLRQVLFPAALRLAMVMPLQGEQLSFITGLTIKCPSPDLIIRTTSGPISTIMTSLFAEIPYLCAVMLGMSKDLLNVLEPKQTKNDRLEPEPKKRRLPTTGN